MTSGNPKTVPGFEKLLSKVSWRLLPFMFVLYIIAYLDRINISFASLQMNQDLGFDDAIFGFASGIFFIGYFLFGIPSTLVMERFGARKWIALIMVVWGVLSMSMAYVGSASVFYVLRFLLGVAEAGFFPGMILYLTFWFPKRERALAVARFMTAIPAAGVIGGLVASQLLGMHGILGMAGWKWLFLITGAPAVIFGLLVLVVLTDRPAEAKWLTPEERSELIDHIDSEHDKTAGAAVGWQQVFADRRVWLFSFMYFSLALAMYGFQLWLPHIIRAVGGTSDSQTALLSAIPAMAQAVGMILIAGHSDKTGERKFHCAGAAVLAACGLVLAAVVNNPIAVMFFLCVTACGIWGTVGPFWALPTSYLRPQFAAASIGLINSVGNLGGFAGPYLVGLIKSHSDNFMSSLFLMACSLVTAAIIAITIKPVATYTEKPNPVQP